MNRYCRECGALCMVNNLGVSNHIYENGDTHFVLDGDHVALPEFEDTLINEEIFDLCREHYSTKGAFPYECTLSNGNVYTYSEIFTILTEDQKLQIKSDLK